VDFYDGNAVDKGSVEESSLTSGDMRRRKRKAKDEAQSSLDRFAQSTPKVQSEADVPSMPDLDLLEAAEARLEAGVTTDKKSDVPQPQDGPRRLSMPSANSATTRPLPSTTMTYHDLGVLYPNAPVPLYEGEMVLHNSTLLDLTGCGRLMDWVAEGHGCIVEMKRMMRRTTEFNQALSTLSTFVEGDVKGQIIRITDTRLLLLPQGCRGIKGTDMEGFAVLPDELTDVFE
jgi:hypothetical protein